MPESFHNDFAGALTGSGTAGLARWLEPGTDPRRFSVYRNTVVGSAIEALRSAYPAVNRLVGESFFSLMARTYWQDTPPRARTMTLYGETFPAHVGRYEPASSLPYLQAVADCDRAWLEAHHAAEAMPLDAITAAGRRPGDLPRLAPGLHPSARLLRHDWPGLEIWRRNRFETDPEALDVRPGDFAALVWRRRGEVRHRALSIAEWRFLHALKAGLTIELATADALTIDPGFEAAAFFGTALADEFLGRKTDAL